MSEVDAKLGTADAWRLALIVGDDDAIRVATAFYALPEKHRRDLDRLSDASGIGHDVGTILRRLETAGVLKSGDPPPALVRLIAAHVAKHLK